MFEGVEFAKGSTNVPDSVRVTIESDEKMQFYEANIRIIARFGGLRWILYHHRILSFLIFTTMFWTSSMLSMGIVWFILSSSPSSSSTAPLSKQELGKNGQTIKDEPTDSDVFDPASTEDLSDTSRSFPTLGRQMPLHFSGRKKDDDIKREENSPAAFRMPSMTAHEADDEDEEGRASSEWRDSGIGTSRDEERREEVRRRRKTFLESGA